MQFCSILSDRLKNETQLSHLELEKRIIPIIKNIKVTADYAHLLQLFYGYFMPVEKLIHQHINYQLLPDVDSRRKSSLIEDDLHFIGWNTNNQQVCTTLPQIDDLDEALGAMYVLEGSTLGGMVISKMIVNNLQLESDDGIKFFKGYGNNTMQMWSVFKNYLNNYSTHPSQHQKVITAANETFTCFKNWVGAN